MGFLRFYTRRNYRSAHSKLRLQNLDVLDVIIDLLLAEKPPRKHLERPISFNGQPSGNKYG